MPTGVCPDAIVAMNGDPRAARARDDRVRRFPVPALRPLAGRDGVHGRFRIRCDAGQRLAGIERLA